MAKKAVAKKKTAKTATTARTAKKAKSSKTAKSSGSAKKKTSAKAKGAGKAAKRGSQKRETLTRGRKDTAFAKRRTDGTFKEIDKVSRSLSGDSRKKARTRTKKGFGDKGDK